MVGVVERLAGRALLGESEAKAAGLRAETVDLWRLFQRGAYYDVLASPLGRKLLREGGERESAAGCETREEEGKGARGEDRAGALVAEVDPDTASDRARTLLRSSPSAETAAAVSWVGAAALCRFVQANWTSGGGRKGGEAVLRALSVDGEAPYILLASPELLLVARALLIEPLAELVATAQDGTNKSPDSPQGSLVAASANWWAARTAMVHQWCLSGTAPKLEAVISKCMRAASDALEASASAEGAMLGARVMVIDLAARPELNGLIGVAGRWDAERGRYAFKSEAGGDGLWLKPDNLLRVATEAGQVAGESDAGGEGDGGMVVRLRALARLESVQQLLTHRKHAQAVAQLQLACSTLGISLSTSGALGRRTRHQQTATAQLTMQVAFAPHAAPRPARLTPGDVMAAAAAAELPKRVDAEDDTLLDEVQLEDDEAGGQGACGPALWPVEQMAVLAQAAVVRSGSAAHSTTVEQVHTARVAGSQRRAAVHVIWQAVDGTLEVYFNAATWFSLTPTCCWPNPLTGRTLPAFGALIATYVGRWRQGPPLALARRRLALAPTPCGVDAAGGAIRRRVQRSVADGRPHRSRCRRRRRLLSGGRKRRWHLCADTCRLRGRPARVDPATRLLGVRPRVKLAVGHRARTLPRRSRHVHAG